MSHGANKREKQVFREYYAISFFSLFLLCNACAAGTGGGLSPIAAGHDIAEANLRAYSDTGTQRQAIEQTLPDLGDASSYAVSSNDERILSEQIKREIRNDPSYINDPLLTDYLNDLGSRLASQQTNQSFEFFGVRDAAINAFAMPGGFIGVHTGLIALAESESELASVLGHEMGHVLQKHYARGEENGNRTWPIIAAGIALSVLAAASKNPDAVQGMVAGSQALAIDKTLAFSRDAEREADRVGFQLLQASGFNPEAAPLFFERLQRATSLNQSSQTSYVRTHPLTSDRIADMQNRARAVNAKTPLLASLAFSLERMRARVLQAEGLSALQNLNDAFDALTTNRDTLTAISAWYGKSLISQQRGNWVDADRSLAQARQLLEKNGKLGQSPELETTAVELALQQNLTKQALALSDAGIAHFPTSRAMGMVHLRALIAAGRYDDAVRIAQENSKKQPKELAWWDFLAQAYAAMGQQTQQHRALAERFSLLTSWGEALEQLKIARRISDADFYTLSEIDARINQIERIKKESQADTRP